MLVGGLVEYTDMLVKSEYSPPEQAVWQKFGASERAPVKSPELHQPNKDQTKTRQITSNTAIPTKD